jgi:hypothetical protein
VAIRQQLNFEETLNTAFLPVFTVMGHAQSIRTVKELQPHFRSLLLGVSRFRWKEEPDGTLICSVDQASARFRPVFTLGVSAHQVQTFSELGARPEARPLVVVPALSGIAYETCRKHGVSCLDLNGRVFLRASGFLVERPSPTSRRFRAGFPARRLFAGRACRLARVLLTQPGMMWAIRDLAREAKLSVGSVQSLLVAYHREGLVAGTRGDWRVVSPDTLLDAWQSADLWEKRVTESWFNVELADWRLLCGQILRKLGRNAGLAFTQFAGARLRRGDATMPWVAFYTQLPFTEVATALGWQLGRGHKGVLVLSARDPAVSEHVTNVDGLPICCDAQVYIDLIATGSDYAADAEEFRKWTGFLKKC